MTEVTSVRPSLIKAYADCSLADVDGFSYDERQRGDPKAYPDSFEVNFAKCFTRLFYTDEE